MSRKGLVVAAAIIPALAAHFGWSYWPRERAGRLEEGSLTAAVLLSSDLPYRAWVPYPHQNLGVLERFRRRSQAVARLADLPAPELPSFGPLAAPPAHDLALASSADGRRVVLAARVYRPVAVLARWAGHLAGNPWLAGGAVRSGGDEVTVAWEGATWTVRRDAALPAEGAQPPGSAEPVLAALVLGRAAGPLPIGLYRLRRRGGALVLSTAGGEALVPPGFLAAAGVPLAMFQASDRAVELLALLPAPADAGLPRWAQVHRGAGRRPSLPGEKLYDLLGKKTLTAGAEGSRWAGTDEEALEVAGTLAAKLPTAAESSSSLRFAVVGNLGEAATALGPLVDQLAQLPFDETRRWSAVLAAAAALGEWSEVSVVVRGEPAAGAAIRLDKAGGSASGD